MGTFLGKATVTSTRFCAIADSSREVDIQMRDSGEGAHDYVPQHSTDAGNAATALQISGLCKQFGDTVAVDDLNLSVPHGSLFGLVGPNGAGKTTSLSMSVGLLRPDAGSVRIFGIDVWEDPIHAKELVGVLPDGLSLPERLTGRELLTYIGQLRRLDRATVAARADELLGVLELTETERTLVIDYSAGMRKKIGLATALMHAPKLLVLDEPFEAVDPVSASTIRTILARFVAAGGAVVLSSHVMELVEKLCDHVAVITRGRVVASGPVAEVRGGGSLEEAFVHLVGGRTGGAESLSWLAS
jgi:ABC-2 type transport system ATP-binding protein